MIGAHISSRSGFSKFRTSTWVLMVIFIVSQVEIAYAQRTTRGKSIRKPAQTQNAKRKSPRKEVENSAPPSSSSSSSAITVEWYQPETERAKTPGLAKVIISGKTQPRATIEIDRRLVTVIRGLKEDSKKVKVQTLKGRQQEDDIARAKANAEGFFEVGMEVPQGLLQIPIVIIAADKSQRTFLITSEVRLNKVKMNTKISRNKPPAAAKSVRLWMGLGTTYQKYSQTVGDISDVSFQNFDSPSVLVRAGYWKGDWGIDFFYRDAPGKIESADEPFKIASTQYHWKTYELRGLYQFSRSDGSRMWGYPSQWQLLFGTQMHQIPFLDIDSSNEVNILGANLNMATLGIGLLLGQERDWSYEFALEYQVPLSSSGKGGDEFKVSAPMAFDMRIGATYKLAPNWRIGLFTYLQSHAYNFEYANNTLNTKTSGKQNLFYSTFDFHLGYEY